LIEYSLEPNPDTEHDKNLLPQKLALTFSTADVVLLGWRLGLLADKLQENGPGRRARPCQTLRRHGPPHALCPLLLHHTH
jgi:hypothetical protein